jgi:hypothetical protein
MIREQDEGGRVIAAEEKECSLADIGVEGVVQESFLSSWDRWYRPPREEST